jgi:predicted DNA-binding protein (MmcQ/YjbR family)
VNIEDFREYCLSRPGATEEILFRDSTLVFKVSGKIFALTGIEQFGSVNLKCDPARALLLRELFEEVQPGYHMNKQHWNTIHLSGRITDQQLKTWVDDSYRLVVEGLPKAQRQMLEGLQG